MKTVGSSLLAHYAAAQGVTTLARCWKCTRSDAAVFGFTNHDVDIVFGGVTYLAASGFTQSAIEGKLDLSVANLEVSGVLDSSCITEADLLAGKWDNAQVEIFEVNYADLTMGRMMLPGGRIGNVSTGRVAFTAELRGLGQALQQPVGEVYAAACTARLGDARCGIALEGYRVTGAVTTATSWRVFADSSRIEVDDYFGSGVVTWLTGANAGLSMEIAAYVAKVFTLHLAMPYAVALGDTYSVVPGCRKRRTEDCRDKFANVVNFRGFPDVPLNDKVIGNATAASPPE